VTRAEDLLPQLLADHLALTRRQAEADRLLGAALAGHLVAEPNADAERAADGAWRLDPIPLVLDGEVFDELAAHVVARVEGLEALLADLYGPREAIKQGWVPAEVLASSPRYRLAAVGAPAPPRWLTAYAADVVALADGSWRLVQDRVDPPSGVGFAQIDRSVMAHVAAEVLGPERHGELASISGFPADLRWALAATARVASPRIVVFTGGVSAAAYVEHSALARLLGFHLVEAADLVVRRGHLWLRTLGGLDPVDVVFRRLADGAVDPVEVNATNTRGVPGLLLAASEAGVVLANAHGCGVVEDPALAPYWGRAIEGLTGVSLGLPVLEAGAELATVPTFRERRVGMAHAVVRLHAVAGPDGVVVMAGGNGRVLADGDDPRRPTARVGKDVWVLGADRARPAVLAPLPQVDLVASVPTRAADAMFWLGRAAERAEAIAKTSRVVAARRLTDPSLATFDGGRWARRMTQVVRVARGEPLDAAPVEGRPIVVLDEELRAATRAVSERLTALLAAASTVAEYLPGTAGRVLRSMAATRDDLAGGRAALDGLDACIADLAAFAGLWGESTVRGPAWRFGELGRRIERATVVLGTVDACLRPATGGDEDPTGEVRLEAGDVVDRAALEVMLAANESLVAYRRHHRSDVELDAAANLLLADLDNPRSYLASIDRLAEHVAAIDWSEGRRAVAVLAGLLDAETGDLLARVRAARAGVQGFAALVHATWFATPVNPTVVPGRIR
jgi:uncharacterized circularly permuted ATP-grasp superfamily protein/uncharacterized alpha-E superfamily protein